MRDEKKRQHRAEIVYQFSRQAIPFTLVPGHRDAIGLLLEFSGVSAADRVLDVACGPGMVAAEFARRAEHVTGIDLTTVMLDQARCRQRELQIGNLDWVHGDADRLPWSDASFSLVITRYSFHHFTAPEQVLAEMIRVCRPGGRVMVADVSLPADKAAAYDVLEKLRDPSHVHALNEKEFDAVFQRSGLMECRRTSYAAEIELEAQLQASFPHPGDKEKLRTMITADIGVDTFGINARRSGQTVVYSCPIAVFAGRKS